MTGMKAMRDYVEFSRRPFTSIQIVNELGICYETVKKYLQDFTAEGFVRQIGYDKGRKVYIHVKYKECSTNYRVNGQKHYTLESVQEAYRRQMQKYRDFIDDLL